MDQPRCRNAAYDHPCRPHYAKKYDGYCLDCANAGVPELAERVRELESEVAALRESRKTTRERLTDVLRGCAGPVTGRRLAEALGELTQSGRVKVWSTLNRMERLGEVERVVTKRSGQWNRECAWRLT